MNELWRALPVVLLLGGCAAPGWSGEVARWGSMREVMREGRTEARVPLDAALSSGETVGIGALAGLAGEIAILDGVAWVARTDGGRLECERGARPGDRATLLATAQVREWAVVQLDADVAAEDFDALLGEIGAGAHLAGAWPFVVDGEFAGVEAHVLRGECPFAGEVAPGREPVRRSFERVRGKLVGFYAPEAVGDLVHAGQASHAHLVVRAPEVFVGHVERAGVRAGSRLLIPAK